MAIKMHHDLGGQSGIEIQPQCLRAVRVSDTINMGGGDNFRLGVGEEGLAASAGRQA